MNDGSNAVDAFRRRFLAGAGALGLTSLAGCSVPSVTRRQASSATFSVPDDTPFGIVNRNGSVTIETEDRDDVALDIVKRSTRDPPEFGSASIEGRVEDGVFLLRTTYEGEPGFNPVSVELTATVPEAQEVVRAETANGNVDVRNTTGDLTLRSGNGSVEARGVDGYVSLRSTNGSVTARDVTGVDAASASNGSVDLDLLGIRDDVEVSTGNGGVDVDVGPDLSARFDVSVGNGSIDVRGLAFSDVERGPRRFSGVLGDGGDTVTVSVGNGSVELVGTRS